jgi:predicted polyphosphate/ATP-dependent NAD kinase
VATVGVLANPAAGKDVRRLVAHAAPVADGTKVAILRRVLAGAVEAGATRLLLAPDHRRLAERALDGLDTAGAEVCLLGGRPAGGRCDTVGAARTMALAGAGAVVALGGDGTCRDVAAGWPDVPLVALSTGTNNVFPVHVEPTLAGLAAGLVAAGVVALGGVAARAERLHLRIDGESVDPALVEAAVIAGRVTGSGAVWDAAALRSVLACIAEPDAVGLSAVAAGLHLCGRHEDGAVLVTTGSGATKVRVALLPGVFATVGPCTVRRVTQGETVGLTGPGVLAVDGERVRPLGDGETVEAVVRRDGPRVIDVRRTLAEAAHLGWFRRGEGPWPPSS